MSTLPEDMRERVDGVLDLFAHAVINYGQQEGSRTKLKAKYGQKIMALLQEVDQKARS